MKANFNCGKRLGTPPIPRPRQIASALEEAAVGMFWTHLAKIFQGQEEIEPGLKAAQKEMTDAINVGQGSDRLLLQWDLSSERVARCAQRVDVDPTSTRVPLPDNDSRFVQVPEET